MSNNKNRAATDLRRSAVLKFVLGIACGLVGAAAVYLALQMVGVFGEGLGVDERSRQLYSRAHIVIHAFGTVSAIAIATFIAIKHRTLTVIAVLAMLACGGYGI